MNRQFFEKINVQRYETLLIKEIQLTFEQQLCGPLIFKNKYVLR